MTIYIVIYTKYFNMIQSVVLKRYIIIKENFFKKKLNNFNFVFIFCIFGIIDHWKYFEDFKK